MGCVRIDHRDTRSLPQIIHIQVGSGSFLWLGRIKPDPASRIRSMRRLVTYCSTFSSFSYAKHCLKCSLFLKRGHVFQRKI
jgi:hypothetical protein